MRTNLPNVFAIGDCVGGKLLAHKAEDEGVIAAEVIAGKPVHMHYHSIPAWCTHGRRSPPSARRARGEGSGRSTASASSPSPPTDARARRVTRRGSSSSSPTPTTDELLGAHMIGPNVSELIAEVVLAFEYRGSAEDIGITVHAHPTLSEVTKEAALAALGRAIHI
jgi:dihydrolipoamide dehydrogenase